MAGQNEGMDVFILVEPTTGAVVPQADAEKFIRATEETLKEVARLIQTSCQSLVSEVRGMASPPAEIGIEFGIDVGAEGGVPFITKGSIGANFKVLITWR